MAVLGTGERGTNEALFPRSYTADITLVASGDSHELSTDERASLIEAAITIVDSCREIRLTADRIVLDLDQGPADFDSVYAVWGPTFARSSPNRWAPIAPKKGVSPSMRTSAPTCRAYAPAGDVVIGLDLISHAMGEGGVAATTIRNDLAGQTPLRR